MSLGGHESQSIVEIMCYPLITKDMSWIACLSQCLAKILTENRNNGVSNRQSDLTTSIRGDVIGRYLVPHRCMGDEVDEL